MDLACLMPVRTAHRRPHAVTMIACTAGTARKWRGWAREGPEGDQIAFFALRLPAAVGVL